MPASPEQRWPRAVALAIAASLLAPAPALARRSPPEQPTQPPTHTSTPEPDASTPEPDASTPEPDASTPEPQSESVELGEVEATVESDPDQAPPTSSGGIASVVDPKDPNATRAQADLEGESLDGNIAGVPDRLPKLQAAGWWTTFGAVALATTGGIFASIAETRQDQAERLAYAFDLETGQATLYGPVADEYERTLREGNSYQWVARGCIIAGGLALIAGISIFAVEGVQRRKHARSSARLRIAPGPSGLSLRF